MNLPNLITIGRFFFIPLFILTFFSYQSNLFAFLILLAAGISDILDGYLARKNGQVTDIGKLLDPLADKLMMITVILAFVMDDRISWWAAGVFFFRDIGMILISAFYHFNGKRQVPTSNIFGKATTVFFYVAFLMIMFELPYHSEMLWSTILFSLFTSCIYFFIFRRLNTPMKRASQ
ncbi:CDP-alcohol phosphatidyltransferase family protein [Caldalkalibacillus mannanilyticus]|uniref:CDP-alcohol phosphatidyltransferase family protein n=1 Tax=Caldalkalibacillus mannanilyticus TaxID=1418 RepID=UPI00046AC963|nr:CDP-alcohol phosphatidyltransferase family protein [Caldalkalibacillus mannanilyticus]